MPVQVPSSSVSVPPSSVLPVSVGATALAGGSAITALVGSELAVASPATLEAVTATRTAWPMSSPVST